MSTIVSLPSDPKPTIAPLTEAVIQNPGNIRGKLSTERMRFTLSLDGEVLDPSHEPTKSCELYLTLADSRRTTKKASSSSEVLAPVKFRNPTPMETGPKSIVWSNTKITLEFGTKAAAEASLKTLLKQHGMQKAREIEVQTHIDKLASLLGVSAADLKAQMDHLPSKTTSSSSAAAAANDDDEGLDDDDDDGNYYVEDAATDEDVELVVVKSSKPKGKK